MSRKRIALAILLVLVVALFAATARWIVWPPTDAAPKHADALIVLGGGGAERLDEGLRLMRRGVAPVLVISEGTRPGWTEANDLCENGDPDFEVICFDPDPSRTQGEARGAAKLAREHGWKDVIVVTSDYHATRAGWLFGRCFDRDVPVVGAGSGLPGPRAIVHEWFAYAHGFLIARDC
jgi:uncharacterized SAM-binding protein YcdF (DUF218 family)